MPLDARDSLELGRNEDAVILAWCSLEAGCRQAISGLAYGKQWTIAALANGLESPGRKKTPLLSFEEAVNRVSSGFKIVEVAAKLAEPLIYDSRSVVSAVEMAYRLRNKIAHQGAIVSPTQARQIVEAVDDVVTQALSLRDVEPPPAMYAWENHYGAAPNELRDFVSANDVRLVLTNPREGFFEIEVINHDLWIGFAPDIDANLAAAFTITEWDTWRRRELPNRPRLRVNPGGFFLAGSTNLVAQIIESCVCRAEELIFAKSFRE